MQCRLRFLGLFACLIYLLVYSIRADDILFQMTGDQASIKPAEALDWNQIDQNDSLGYTLGQDENSISLFSHPPLTDVSLTSASNEAEDVPANPDLNFSQPPAASQDFTSNEPEYLKPRRVRYPDLENKIYSIEAAGQYVFLGRHDRYAFYLKESDTVKTLVSQPDSGLSHGARVRLAIFRNADHGFDNGTEVRWTGVDGAKVTSDKITGHVAETFNLPEHFYDTSNRHNFASSFNSIEWNFVSRFKTGPRFLIGFRYIDVNDRLSIFRDGSYRTVSSFRFPMTVQGNSPTERFDFATSNLLVGSQIGIGYQANRKALRVNGMMIVGGFNNNQSQSGPIFEDHNISNDITGQLNLKENHFAYLMEIDLGLGVRFTKRLTLNTSFTGMQLGEMVEAGGTFGAKSTRRSLYYTGMGVGIDYGF